MDVLRNGAAGDYGMSLQLLGFLSAMSFYECHPSENEAVVGFRVNGDRDSSSPLSLPR